MCLKTIFLCLSRNNLSAKTLYLQTFIAAMCPVRAAFGGAGCRLALKKTRKNYLKTKFNNKQKLL